MSGSDLRHPALSEVLVLDYTMSFFAHVVCVSVRVHVCMYVDNL